VPALDLEPRELATVRAILARHVPNCTVCAFGSRVRGTARRTSDLDLAIMTERPLDAGRMADLREAFSESDLPFLVDLVDWAATGEGFRRIIADGGVEIAPGRGAELC